MTRIPWKLRTSRRTPLRRCAKTFYQPTLELLEGRVLLATLTWSGFGTNSNWSSGANWQGGTPPSGGDDLRFPAGAAQSTATNDFAAATFNSITFTGGGFDLKGNAVTLAAGIVNSTTAGTNLVEFGGITLSAPQTFSAGSAGNLNITSPVSTNGKAVLLDGTAGLGSMAGAVNGGGGLTKNGSGTWGVSGNNSYTGNTAVNAGILSVTSAGGLGSTAGGTTVIAGATLRLVGSGGVPLPVAEPLVFNGAGSGPNGALDLAGNGANLTGAISLGSNTTFTGTSNFSTFSGLLNTNNFPLILGGTLRVNITGPVSGTGSITMAGVNLSGTTTIPGVVNLTSGGLSPGLAGSQPGLLTTGGANLAAGTIFHVELNSTVPRQFSELDATGNVNLNGANLDISLHFTTAPGDAFPIVSSAAAITGIFNGLPDGTPLTVNGQRLVIRYVTGPSGSRLQPSSQVILENPLPSGGSTVTGFKPILPGENIFATSADAGGGPDVKVYDAPSGAFLFNFFAYDPAFTGGVRIAIADVNGDGVQDIITAAGPGGGPNVTVFNGKTGHTVDGPLGSFFAFNPNFTGGLYVAGGDVNGDGFADIICGADRGGGPNVTVFSGKDGTALMSFFPYDIRFTGGVRVAAADVNGDGRSDIVCGAGPGGGPNVTVVSGLDFAPIRSFFAYDPGFSAGIYVAAGDTNGDGKADIVVGAGPGGGPNVATFSGADSSVLLSFFPYDPAFTGGVRVGAVDRNSDGKADILTVAGPGGGPDVASFSGLTGTAIDHFFAYDPRFSGGLYVAGTGR